MTEVKNRKLLAYAGNKLHIVLDEQDGNAFDEPIADLTLDEIDEIAKTYGMTASRATSRNMTGVRVLGCWVVGCDPATLLDNRTDCTAKGETIWDC